MTTATETPATIWRRAHYLDRMNLRELVRAFFQHPTVIVYILLALAAAGVAAAWPTSPARVAAAIAAGTAIYPLAWYGIHRFILHGRWMWRTPMFAKTWKRIHYDHHQDPNHMEVLFGAVEHTLPAVAVSTALAGWMIGGLGGAAAAFAAGLVITLVYEFIHCIQHLGIKPRATWLATMKRRHMEHHFHDENGNYGIVSFFPDRWFGTLYVRADRPRRSATVFNLGYTAEVAARYPWVAALSGGAASDQPRRRVAAAAAAQG